MELRQLKLEQEGGVGDNLTANLDYNGQVCIECEEPWAGDTEAGFGRSGAVTLTTAQATQLMEWLAAAIRAQGRAE